MGIAFVELGLAMGKEDLMWERIQNREIVDCRASCETWQR